MNLSDAITDAVGDLESGGFTPDALSIAAQNLERATGDPQLAADFHRHVEKFWDDQGQATAEGRTPKDDDFDYSIEYFCDSHGIAWYAYPEDHAEPDLEPHFDDSVLCCPDCDRPNQFGEVCATCQQEREIEAQEMSR